MKSNTLLSSVPYVCAVGASVVVLLFFVASVWIGYEAKNLCQNAVHQYGGSCKEALIAQLDDTHQSFRAKNAAIWALGQFGDKKALVVLRKYYTGVIPDREPLDTVISQYELQKAIRLVEGGTNITSWLWRGEIGKTFGK